MEGLFTFDESKKALFRYLAESVLSLNLAAADVTIVSTLHDYVISSRRLDTESLTNCKHEEADSRLFSHVRHAAAQGLKKVIIRTANTDVVVLAVANVHNLQTDALGVSFGVGKNQRFLDINAIASKLAREKCVALPFFMSSQDVIPHHISVAEERRRPSKHGTTNQR